MRAETPQGVYSDSPRCTDEAGPSAESAMSLKDDFCNAVAKGLSAVGIEASYADNMLTVIKVPIPVNGYAYTLGRRRITNRFYVNIRGHYYNRLDATDACAEMLVRELPDIMKRRDLRWYRGVLMAGRDATLHPDELAKDLRLVLRDGKLIISMATDSRQKAQRAIELLHMLDNKDSLDSEANAIFRAIIESPWQAPAYADWLEDRGEYERAEAIRNYLEAPQ